MLSVIYTHHAFSMILHKLSEIITIMIFCDLAKVTLENFISTETRHVLAKVTVQLDVITVSRCVSLKFTMPL